MSHLTSEIREASETTPSTYFHPSAQLPNFSSIYLPWLFQIVQFVKSLVFCISITASASKLQTDARIGIMPVKQGLCKAFPKQTFIRLGITYG